MADTNTYFTSKLTGETISPATILSLQLGHLQEKVEEGNSHITDANIGSELRNLLESIDIGFYKQLFELNNYGEQLFLRYATGNWLDEKAYEYGYSRNNGERASGNVTFYLSSPTSTRYVIYEGTAFLGNDNGLTYILTDDVVFDVGDTSATGFAIAEHVGEEYNCEANTITIFDTEQDIRSDCKVTNLSAFINGENVEEDEALRERILSNIRGGNFGSKAHYKALCEEIDNVHDVAFISPVLLNNKYGQGRHTVTIDGTTEVCNDCTNVCVINYDSKDDVNDSTFEEIVNVLTDQDNLVLGHEFHFQDARKQKFFFKIAYYGENGASVSEEDVNQCLEKLFYGGTYEGKSTVYYDGYDIGETVYKSEIINALENMTNLHHVESIKLLAWHNDMPTKSILENYWRSHGKPNFNYNNLLDYPDEDDATWIANPSTTVPHWKHIDANLGKTKGNSVYQLEIQDYFFYKIKDNDNSTNNSGEYGLTFNENENMYWLWGQKNFDSLTIADDSIPLVGALYEKQPYLLNNVKNTHIIQLEKL